MKNAIMEIILEKLIVKNAEKSIEAVKTPGVSFCDTTVLAIMRSRARVSPEVSNIKSAALFPSYGFLLSLFSLARQNCQQLKGITSQNSIMKTCGAGKDAQAISRRRNFFGIGSYKNLSPCILQISDESIPPEFYTSLAAGRRKRFCPSTSK